MELFRAIHEQTQARFLEVFDWRKGEAGFVRGARSHEETFPLGMDPFELVARGVREGYSTSELEAILTPLDEELLEPVAHPPMRLEAFRLEERQLRVLRSVTQPMSLAALREAMLTSRQADAADVFTAVFLGLSCELLRSSRWETFTATAP